MCASNQGQVQSVMNENFTQIGFEAFLFANKAVPIAGAEITDDELFRRVKAFEKRLGEMRQPFCVRIEK